MVYNPNPIQCGAPQALNWPALNTTKFLVSSNIPVGVTNQLRYHKSVYKYQL